MSFSIRGRLFWSLLIAITVLAAAATVAIYQRAKSSIDELFDYEMRQLAYSVGAHMSSHPEAVQEPLLSVEHDFLTQVWTTRGTLVASSRWNHGPDKPLAAGFSTWGSDNTAWRVFSAPTGAYVLQVAQPLPHRREAAAKLALNAIAPGALILPIGGIIIWFGIGYGLKPLRTLTRQLRARDPASLAPLAVALPPAELVPLRDALNSLLLRLSHALEAERQFIADASHELRTPATALRLQLDLFDSASTPEERDEAMRDIRRGVARMQRLIEQILTLARLDPANVTQNERIALGECFDELRDEFSPLASAKNIRLAVNVPEATVRGDVMAFRALVRNLLDNAIRYTPEAGTVTVSSEESRETVFLRIADSGPGIPCHLRSKVFARFVRGDTHDEEGTGLGLAIAKRAAERLGAELEFEDQDAGTGVVAVVRLRRDTA